MSEEETQHHPDPEETPRARVHIAEWSPWVWVLPLIALLFVGWLVVRYGYFGGGDVTVTFADARGLERFSPVRFKGAKVGTVQKITIDEEFQKVVVRISLDSMMKNALRSDTRFWIVEPGLEGGLGSLLAGTYVAIAPGGSDDKAKEFVGQEYAPILQAPEEGKIFILKTKVLGGLTVGAPVYFDGFRVGRVLGAEHDQANTNVLVHVFIVDRYAGRVRQETRFHRTGGLSFSLSGGGISMGDSSLATLLTGGIGMYTPEVLAGGPVATGTRFDLYDSQAAAIAASGGPHLTYMTYFPDPVGGLQPGTRVEMKGMQVGRVRDVRLVYVPDNATLVTPVMIEIDPRELDFEIYPSTTREDLRREMDAALDALVRKGMRATLATSLILPGASAVSLEIVERPGTGRLILTQDPPVIPAAGGGSGLEATLASINRLAQRIDRLPLTEIAGHLRSAAQRIDTLVADPAIDESVRSVQAAASEIERAAATIGENAGPIAQSLRNAAETAETSIGPIAESLRNAATTTETSVAEIAQSLRNAAGTAETAAARLEQLIGGSVQQGYDLGELVKELTRAAEAVRTLADFLTENPDAVLKGRPK
jgi:paraquat-inducible protein B